MSGSAKPSSAPSPVGSAASAAADGSAGGAPPLPKAPLPRVPLSPEDFYMEGAFLVFTAAYHLRRGYCCNSNCRHCPYKEIEE